MNTTKINEIRDAIQDAIEDDCDDSNGLAAVIADRVVVPLLERLKAAEDVATAFGWTGVDDGERAKAASVLYGRWIDLVGLDFAGPRAHPDLNVTELARQYDEDRTRNLAKLRGEGQ